jgi:hypothetical protein
MATVTPGMPPKAEGVLSPQNKAFGNGKMFVSFKVARQSALVLPVGRMHKIPGCSHSGLLREGESQYGSDITDLRTIWPSPSRRSSPCIVLVVL